MADDDARARRTSRAAAGGTAKKATAKKPAPAKAAPAKKAVKAVPATRATAAKKAPVARKVAPARDRGATLAPRPKKAPQMRLAAEQTFGDDDAWDEPAPQPVREDPHARIRSLLRTAALQVEGRLPAPPASAPPPAQRPTPPPPAPPPPVDEPVTRVLVSPPAPEEDEWLAEDSFEDELDEEEFEEWAAPEVLEEDEDEGMSTIASAPPLPAASAPPPPPARTDAAPPAPAAPTADFTPPPFEPPAPAPAAGKQKGAGSSVLAIVASLLIPVVGPIVGFFLARKARRDGAALSGLARVIAVVLLIAWLVAAGVVAYRVLVDDGIDYSKLKVGDCFDSSTSNEIRGITLKPCAEPHNSEIFFLVTHPAGPNDAYPGKDALVQFAADACLGPPLTEYLGIPLEQSKLKDFEIVPQESAWKDGRRVLVCGLDTGGQGDVTGSVRGTRR